MRSNLFFISCLSIFLLGCASAPPVQIQAGADSVQVSKTGPGEDYDLLEEVSGSDGSLCGELGYEGTYERAVIKLQNRTQYVGGDYAQITNVIKPHMKGECFDNVYRLEATAYKRVRNIPEPAPVDDSCGENSADKLRKLKSLLDDGIISQAEYEDQKAKMLEKGLF